MRSDQMPSERRYNPKNNKAAHRAALLFLAF